MDPNNYRAIMVGHTFSKLYATFLHLKLSGDLERRQLRDRGQLDSKLSTIVGGATSLFESLLLFCGISEGF
jgi:hypothetical protein